jgi:hypothetical protein
MARCGSVLVCYVLLAAMACAQSISDTEVESAEVTPMLAQESPFEEPQPLDMLTDSVGTSTEAVTTASACFPWCANQSVTSYAEAEYLFWSLPGAYLPRLLTSNPTGTALAGISNPADPSTQTLLGGSDVGDEGHSGLRLRYGHKVNGRRMSRWELSGWYLFEVSDEVQFESTGGDPILARPFTNALTGLPDAQLLSLAGVADGSLRSEYDRSLFGVEPLAFFCMSGNQCNSLEAFTGYRYLHYQDELRLTESVRPEAGGLIAPGTEFRVEDTFTAENDFHLIPLGLHYSHRGGLWRFSARASVALGFVRQEVNIRGRTTNLVGGTVDSVEAGGLLALPSNSGSYDRTRFAWVPELNFNVHRALRDNMWLHAGYTLMYLDDVVRAPAHVDTTVDPNQLPPAVGTGVRPAFAYNADGELLHGLNAGISWHY